MTRAPPGSPLFPYTTLFRSVVMGTNWYEAFDQPERAGKGGRYWIGRGDLGRVRGGHAYCLLDRKSTRLNSSHGYISYAVFCLKKQTNLWMTRTPGRLELTYP